jgi:hypothetical protein
LTLLAIAQTPEQSGEINDEFIRSSSVAYRALFSVGDDMNYVLANCGYGIYGIHPTDHEQRVLSIKADMVAAQTTNPATNESASLWNISLTYGAWDFWNKAYDGNPIHVPVRFRIDFTVAEVAAFEDVDGQPIVNAAGDPYDPPLMREVTRSTLTVLRNEAASGVNIPVLGALSNTLNVAAWNGFPAKTCRLEPFKLPDPIYSQVSNSFYFPMQYVFDINYDTWVKQIINAGFRQLDSSGNLVPILINGQPATTPVPLDIDGHAILTPTFKESTADTPDDTDATVTAGGEPPTGGDGDDSDSNLVIDAYDLIHVSDFTVLGMNTLFTLPTIP